MQTEFQKKIDEVTKSMQELKSVKLNHQKQEQELDRFDNMENIHYNVIPKPKCIKCESNLTSISKIYQCPAGHLLCLICITIFVTAVCPICQQPLTRATGLESYLKILFPPTVENYEFLSKDNLPQNISNVE